ncbi:glutamine synthetase [Filimonas sp.]|nr:glutamine synthetase [Filimonas sp.]
MSNLRFDAINNLMSRAQDIRSYNDNKVTALFASNVFTAKAQREYLSDEAYKSLNTSIKTGSKIDRKMAEQIANGMKAWAMERGVTHFSHWFQPLTGGTAEKHDSFFTLKGDGTPLEIFDGDALTQQEPDASSFPNGGIRATFEARGYTAWDPTSPAFILETANGKTMCIPTIFISYSGESLDTKTPLLKALDLVNKAALDVCHLLIKQSTGWHDPRLGAGIFRDRRVDGQCPSRFAGYRSYLIWSHPAKGQQLDDHYFGAIPERVFAYMQDFEQEAYKLGIPLRTVTTRWPPRNSSVRLSSKR